MPLDESTGSLVSICGAKFEELVCEACNASGNYAKTQQKFPNSRNIFGGRLTVDIFIFPNNRFPDGLIVECSRQNSKGSGDHKIPHKVLTALIVNPAPSVIILDGEGFDHKSIDWAKERVGDDWLKASSSDKLLGVFTFPEFLEWIGLSIDWLTKKILVPTNDAVQMRLL